MRIIIFFDFTVESQTFPTAIGYLDSISILHGCDKLRFYSVSFWVAVIKTAGYGKIPIL